MKVALDQDTCYPQSQKTTRSLKGESLLAFPQSYVVLDLETTGFKPGRDEIIEIAALKVESRKIVGKFQSLIKPSVEIAPFITNLTGITDEMVRCAPKLEEVLPSFKSFIGNHILVGYNVAFDVNFLYHSFSEILDCPLSNDFVDCLYFARYLLPHLPNHKLETVSRFFDLDCRIMHRALKDCEATHQCFLKLEEIVRAEFSSLDKFVRDRSRLQRKYNEILRKRDAQQREKCNPAHPLYSRVVVFTGELKEMSRSRAMQEVENLGGKCANSVTKRTDILVVGSFEGNRQIRGEKSSKLLKAERYNEAGCTISIIGEEDFCELLNA